MDSPHLPTGPSPDGQPEPTVPGVIEALLRRIPSDDEHQRRAFTLLQRYRGEALAAITRCADLASRRHAVQVAKVALRERLVALLVECEHTDGLGEPSDPDLLRTRLRDPDLVRLEREYRTEYDRELLEAEQRFHTTYLELLSHETWLHTIDGMHPLAAEGAARANLSLRQRSMEDELQALTVHHHERYLLRLRALAAMQEDRRTAE